VAINLGAISAGTNAALSLSSLILATPTSTTPSATKGYQPLNAPDANGNPSKAALPPTLLFHLEGENAVAIASDITDHYVENNSAIQDQIALKPPIIKVHGFIGELNDVVPPQLVPLQTAANTLTGIASYAPSLSLTALIAYNKALLVYETAENAINSAISAFSSLSPSAFATAGANGELVSNSNVFQSGSNIVQNKQQSMFQQLFGYWSTRTLFNVQTPWAIFANMAIFSINAMQDDKTRMITDFEVTFKQIRTASSISNAGGLAKLQDGRALTASSPVNNLGTQSGTPGFSLAGKIASVV
jgi:hypothetical protein